LTGRAAQPQQLKESMHVEFDIASACFFVRLLEFFHLKR
jgi:hypothetical protein